MKKYLITEDQLSDVRTLVYWLCFGECRTTDRPIPSADSIARMLTAIEPIEPLSDGEIYEVYATATNQTLRPQDERLALAFVREVERHVLGEQL